MPTLLRRFDGALRCALPSLRHGKGDRTLLRRILDSISFRVLQ